VRHTLASLALVVALLPAPAVAQRAGVLLGFDDGTTMWVAPDAEGRVRAHRSDSLLIIPHGGGFWNAGVSITAGAHAVERGGRRRPVRRPQCLETEYRPDWFELAVWAGPIGRKPYIKSLPDSVAAALRRECGTRDITFTFVGSEYLSVDEHYTTEYAAGLNSVQRAGLVPIDSLARRGYADLLDFKAWSTDPLRVDSATDARLLDQCRASRGAKEIDELLSEDFEHELLIRRAPGRWELVMRFSRGGAAWQGMIVECGTSYPLPASIVGYDALPMSWEAIEQQVPGARDAVASPAGDMVVVLAGGRLLVFAPRNGQLGAPIGEAPTPPGDLVMAQWATGTYVAVWSAQLAPYLAAAAAPRGTR
jgi:hypothetical protein